MNFTNSFIKKVSVFRIKRHEKYKTKMNVIAHGFSATAKAAIENLGGTATTL